MTTPNTRVSTGGDRGLPVAEKSAVVTIPEWAADFKMSATTAWGIVRRGEIEVIRYGRSVRITREAVEAWKARSQGRWPDLAG